MKSSNVRKKDKSVELYRLTPLSRKILELVGAGKIAAEAAKLLGCSKSTVSYHVNRFQEKGLLRLKIDDVIKVYELTPFGSKVLTRSEGWLRVPVILEDHPFKFSIVEPEKVGLDWVKLGKPRNWVKLGVKIGKIRVEKHDGKSIIIHTGRIRGFDVNSLLVEAGRIIYNVKSILENKSGMVLSNDGISLHKPVVRFYTEEAKELDKHGTVVVEGVASLDHSPPENAPHVEYRGLENVKNYLVMPNRVARIEQKVDSLEKCLETLTDGLEQVVGSLSRLVNFMESRAAEIREKERGRFESYVS